MNNELFPYLKKFKANAVSADTIEYKIGEIFSELKNRIQSGYNLPEVINHIDELRFQTHVEKHEMSHLYEGKIKNMGNAGRNGGEYYTPRPLIKTIIKVVNPTIGETIYDGAVGSAGFLVEAFEYLTNNIKLTTSNLTTLQKNTFYGKEKKSLAYINQTVTNCHIFNCGTICTLVQFRINNFFSTFEKNINFHAINTLVRVISVVKHCLTTANKLLIYNNMSCKGLLDNSVLGEARG